MSNYSLSVCLSDLDGAKTQTAADGKLYMCIPVEEADLFLSQKGKIYLNLSLWEKHNSPDQYGATHGVKQSYSKARREMLGEAARNKPFLGNVKEIRSNNGGNSPANVYNQQTPPAGYTSTSNNDDLVF